MKAKLQEYALLAEIIGAIAVVVSLVYVGAGVRQNTDAIQVANHQAIVALDMEKNTWLRDPKFVAIYENAKQDVGSLSPVELTQVMTFVADTFNAWEFAYITYNNGAIEDTIWNGWDGFYRSVLREEKPYQWFWDDGGENFSPDFNAYIESIISQAGEQ